MGEKESGLLPVSFPLTNQNDNWRSRKYGHAPKASEKVCDMKYCPICSYTSTEAVDLRCHMASHVSFHPPFNCPVCCKTFSNKYNVQTHMVIHTGERPFECNICFKSFKQKSHMHAHQRNTHSMLIS